MARLPAPAGIFINRDKPIAFSYEGRRLEGFEGDTVASALMANGKALMSRSFKYHRPRGPLTMAGQDANTLVQVGGEPNVLADTLPLTPGVAVTGQNCNGSLQHDRSALLGWFGRFMPVGFYYRAFYKLPFLRSFKTWPLWEPTIRKMAGLGVLDLSFTPEYYDKCFLFHDVVVVGAGPAGLMAALTAAQGGASVLLVDEQPQLGGSLTYHRFDIDGVEADKRREDLVAQVQANDNIQVLTEAVCNAWFTDNYLPVIQGKRMYKVRAKECIVASGAFEQHVVFRNNDLPGVMMASAASRLMKQYGVAPGQRVVCVTGNDDGYMTALDLHDAGVEVAAVVDMRTEPEQHDVLAALQSRGIAHYSNHTVYEALPSSGNRGIRGVELRAITARGEVASQGKSIDCDVVCMSSGYMPVYQLLCQAGGQLTYHDGIAAFTLTNLPKHLHIAGSVNGRHALSAVLADGARAGHIALHQLGLSTQLPADVFCSRRVNFDWPIFSHPKGKDFVDFDEDLQAKDIINATRMGYRDIQLVKRFSTVGMGPSQGRHSALATARLVASATGRTVTETGVTTARPPFAPEKLAHSAGRMFDPYRRTRMHQRHIELGAQMMPAGNWQRPAFYGAPSQRQACIRDEAWHVRHQVGVIDVSTLGGIELRGPDAAELLERMYTLGFAKQPVGKTRYAVMTNEHGVVVDDGVACRLSEQHFYVTATTSGVDGVYRNMMKWNAQWRLNVDIANVTSAFAAVNVAGPLARDVLLEMGVDIDLSPEAFPYLGFRECTLGGLPARLLRVGFVGELGFEIHVPSRFGEALWDAVMHAGKKVGIKPFGVEAQRLLRLEKGHIIVGQDTDGMSHPGELSLTWALNHKKPFFVGRRSVEILMAQPQIRQLVGFTLPGNSPKPEEGHLVLQGDDISGNVTSCEYSPTLDAIIGMAFVGIDQAAVGSQLPIRVDDGKMVFAEVVAMPFFDPDNLRQAL